MSEAHAALAHMWQALGEDDADLALVAPGGYPVLQSHLAVAALTRDAVAAASLAAALLAHDEAHPDTRPSAGEPLVSLDADRIHTAVTSERYFRLNGETPAVWAEFSGFWPAEDGWVRTHANYPHHRARLLSALGLPADATVDAFTERLARLSAGEVEDRVTAADGIAVAVRTPDEWASHPQAYAVRSQPLLGKRRYETTGSDRILSASTNPATPLAGVRVLDFTRVIAGPVATRTLALLGADVLRVDAPQLPEPEWQHLETGAGKRSTLLDLTQAGDRRTLEDLLQRADVVVSGYRPGALAAYGLAAEQLVERWPGLIVGSVSAWGTSGPWAEHRGFDSIVQAASGIAVWESADGIRPGALPAQALDHSAGYLLAAGVLSTLRSRRRESGSWSLEVSLARLAQELLSLTPTPAAEIGTPGEPQTSTVQAPSGLLTTALPALSYVGGPTDWPAPSRPWGADRPEWL